MKRVIEKLTHERKEREEEFSRKLKELKEKTQNFLAPQQFSSNQALTSRLDGPGRDDSEEILLTQHLLPILAGFQNTLEKNFEQMKDDYYELRGWDIATGFPTRERLAELQLEDVADDLAGRELL